MTYKLLSGTLSLYSGTFCHSGTSTKSNPTLNCVRRSTYLRAAVFCCRYLDMNPMTLKLEGDLDILKMYPHIENEAASLRDSKLRAWIQKNMKICLKIKGQGQNVRSS